MTFDERLIQVQSRFEELKSLIADPEIVASLQYASLAKEYSELEDIAPLIESLQTAQTDLEDAKAILDDPDMDADMKELAKQDTIDLPSQIEAHTKTLQIALLPKDIDDDRNAIIEFRAGAGGDEAGLFAAVLLRMYQRYAENQGWRFEVMEISDTGVGGYKDASATISGKGVFARLKFESGVHRVQRVPVTEAGGRIHTSTATVAVLPEAEDVDIDVKDSDVRIDVFRASGAGGQHVNTTDSAVRLTHIPSGIVVSQQDEKSQHKNKAKAFKILRARLYDLERQRLADARSDDRKGQVGTGDRSERIRTYNYPQGRMTDHRINLTLYKLDKIIEGDLDETIEALIAADQAEKLAQLNQG